MRAWLAVGLVALAAAIITALMLATPGGGGQEVSGACTLVPYRAVLYASDGCGVGILEVIASTACRGTVSITGVEVYGVGTAKTINPRVEVEPNGRLYIVVYSTPGGRLAALIRESLDPVKTARHYIESGLCMRGITPGMGYPGTLFWSGHVVMFNWRVVGLEQG